MRSDYENVKVTKEGRIVLVKFERKGTGKNQASKLNNVIDLSW